MRKYAEPMAIWVVKVRGGVGAKASNTKASHINISHTDTDTDTDTDTRTTV